MSPKEKHAVTFTLKVPQCFFGTIGSKWLTTLSRNQAPGIAPKATSSASDPDPTTLGLARKGLHLEPIMTINGRPTSQKPQRGAGRERPQWRRYNHWA